MDPITGRQFRQVALHQSSVIRSAQNSYKINLLNNTLIEIKKYSSKIKLNLFY
jgi:hypothetical protein